MRDEEFAVCSLQLLPTDGCQLPTSASTHDSRITHQESLDATGDPKDGEEEEEEEEEEKKKEKEDDEEEENDGEEDEVPWQVGNERGQRNNPGNAR